MNMLGKHNINRKQTDNYDFVEKETKQNSFSYKLKFSILILNAVAER